MTTESMRVRLVFENRSILSESQRSEGLKRSWILIKPDLEAISDLVDFILRVFDLHEACPNGLVLSMDGFVLPPFESICILKDKDIVRVKRKRSISDDICTLRNGNNTLELEKIPDNTPINAGMKLLANEEFEKETGGYQSETEEDIPDQLEETLHADGTPDKKKVSKKRKASTMMRRSSKRKRSKFSAAEESSDAREEPNGIEAEQNESLQNCSSLPGKISAQKDKSAESEADESSNPDVCGKKCAVLSNMPDGTKELASRSARRKRAKRRWLREEAKKKELEQREILLTDNQHSFVKDNHKCAEEHQLSNRCNDEDDDIVPVVIRPGHIRFEPFSKDSDQAIQEHHTLVWNGITNKKKGQKWGKEKSPYSKRSDRKNLNGASSEIATIEEEALETFQWNGITNKKKGQKWGKEKSPYPKRSDNKNLNGESSEMPTIEEEAPVNVPIDFDKLKPCTSLPKVGDQVAYRLIELSSSWTPELSSFRVGTVSSYDAESNKILLLKVPEYPIVFEEIDEASAVQPSLYGEDASLEIDYSSLVDVRIVKHGNLNSPKAVTNGVSEVAEGDQTSAWGLWPKKNGETQAPTQENGKKISAWDEISEALNAKKAQLSQVDHWNKAESSGRSSWSYRALRGSALGPTMARLRCQNGL